MKNWIIVLFAVLVVLVGAFLPEVLLNWLSHPEVDMDYQQVSVSSESSSDYTWRMTCLAEHYFGEGEHQLTTYISEVEPGEDGGELYTQFLTELNRLVDDGVAPGQLRQLLDGSPSYHIRLYYLFDADAVSGFRFAEFGAAGTNWRIVMCLDVESGKLAKLEYGGSDLIQGGFAAPLRSWYDVLRGFAEYLGLSTTPITSPEQPEEMEASSVRQYYDSCTADKWTAPMASGGSAWLELRVLREDYVATVAVYDGGK